MAYYLAAISAAINTQHNNTTLWVCCSRQQSGLRTLCQSTIAVLYAAIDYSVKNFLYSEQLQPTTKRYSVPISTCLWLQYQYLSMIPACKSLCFHLPITVSILTWWFINITSRNSVKEILKKRWKTGCTQCLGAEIIILLHSTIYF